MLYISIGSRQRRRIGGTITHTWLSGVFNTRQDAEAYLTTIDSERYGLQTLLRLDQTFPLYIWSSGGEMAWLTEGDTRARLQQLSAQTDRAKNGDDWCYANLYRVMAPWQPPRHPGSDYMGALPHHHVTNRTLEWLETSGFEALW